MSGAPTFEELIEIKRDGREHDARQIAMIVEGFTSGAMPDYQMAAWLMAVYFQGMTRTETVALTSAMIDSGRRVDLSSIPGRKVDKHSTGGVADTTTLVVAPLVAACGVPVAKMSGRGLGHTGGTLDKLESVPGFRIELGPEEFVSQVRSIGVAVIAQSPDIDPADKMMYALRDVTATVPSIPLIVGSIISKKIAGGADAIILDVKIGSGAFMKTRAQAEALARELQAVGSALGRDVQCLLSDMDQPLGAAVGNSLEVIEAIETLRGEGPRRLTELCLEIAARMLVMGGVADDVPAGRLRSRAALERGDGLKRFREWMVAQGGEGRVVDDTALLPVSSCSREILSAGEGYVTGFDAETVGRTAMLLGAGRASKEDAIDPGAGLVLDVATGDRVAKGTRLCTMYAATEQLLDIAQERFDTAVRIGSHAPAQSPLFYEVRS